MAVIMRLEGVTGTYIFPAEEMPLFTRQLDYMRPTDQGFGGKRLNCSLSGFTQGNNHREVVANYQALLNIVKCNNLRFVYQADDLPIIDTQVYVDDYNEPSDWKEYEGDYNISFHYFEQPTHSLASLGIQAQYVHATGTYVFDPTPLWSSGTKLNREDWRSSRILPSGASYASEVGVSLQGRLHADDATALRAKMTALEEAFRTDGSLNYGTWTRDMRVDSGPQFSQSFPRNYVDYTIELRYDTEGIIEFSSTRSFGRLHNFPKIKELPWCNTVRIRTFSPLGQRVNYSIKIRANSTTQARSLLANEAANLVTLGGVELEGGTEDWDDMKHSVSLSFSKYYYPPILTNLANT